MVTVLFSLMIFMGATMYLVDHENVVGKFETLGFPPNLIYFMAVAKYSGLVAIWQRKSSTLTEWAYAGFTINLLLAIFAHVNISDGEAPGAIVALVLMAVSYVFYKKNQAKK